MTDSLFMFCLVVPLAGYLFWGITVLPRERWQIFAAIPVRKLDDRQWNGVNLTWYGILTANAYVAAVALLFLLMGAVQVPFAGVAVLAAAMLAVCVPASRLVAVVVEKKAHTFTVGGAVFVGVLLAPWLVLLVNRLLGSMLNFYVPPAATLAAFAIAYAFGEGLGRLACISFGCCYGKPLRAAHPLLRRLFARRSFVFHGATRKISYAGGLEGTEVVPVQALTAILYVGCGLAGIALFLHASFGSSFILVMAVTQGWRVLSEMLRDDYRGGGKVSAYQVMGVVAILYGSGAILLAHDAALSAPDTAAGLVTLWHPAPLIFLQGIWLAILRYTGLSTVTGATLSFHVHQDRI